MVFIPVCEQFFSWETDSDHCYNIENSGMCLDCDEEEEDSDNKDFRHPLYTAPKGLSTMRNCPYCGSEGYLHYESQEIALTGDVLTITRAYYCDNTNCGDYWYQTILVKLGDVISNTVTGEAVVSDSSPGISPAPYEDIEKD